MSDGAVLFITDSIDAGDGHASTVFVDMNADGDLSDSSGPPTTAGVGSPFGLWGSMGTRGSAEVVGEF
jgi:hypothetical protein